MAYLGGGAIRVLHRRNNGGKYERAVPTRGDTMKFLVADDHELIRQGVKGLLRGLDPDALFDEADTEPAPAGNLPDIRCDLAHHAT